MTTTVEQIEDMIGKQIQEVIWFKAPGDTVVDVSLSVITKAIEAAETYHDLNEILDTLDIPYCYVNVLGAVGHLNRWST
jgi:hypothetical protein